MENTKKQSIILMIMCLMACVELKASLPDSIWYDSITDIKVHFQRVDTFAKDECPMHIFGKKPDGTPKLPALQSLIEDLSINALVFSWDHFVARREWSNMTSRILWDNIKGGWVWDSDSFSGNQFSHPYHGGMFYNSAREHGLSYGVSLMYPIAGSLTWELMCETNKPAINDLISTGVGGAAIGEVFHRTSDIFFDNSKRGASRVMREVIGSLFNPVRGLHRIVSGDMFRVNHLSAGKKEVPEPFSFRIGAGTRYINDMGDIHPQLGHRYHENVPFFDIRFNYGNHYNKLDEGKPNRAFDYFDFYALINLTSNQPTVGEFELLGRIGSYQKLLPHRWKIDVGFYQNIKYIDHFSSKEIERPGNLSIISEAASFGAGLYAKRHGKSVSLKNEIMLSAVPLGGSAADYYPLRRYNFGTGFSVRHRFEFVYNRHLSFGNSFYFMRLFIMKGSVPSDLNASLENPDFYSKAMTEGINSMGDKGEHSVILNRLFANVNLFRNLQLHMQSEFYLRHGNYRYYPSVTAKSMEWKAGLIYSL